MQSPPIRRLPDDLNFTPSPPTGPDGSAAPYVLVADALAFTINRSNTTYDLNGHMINDLLIADGVSHTRITNGRVGTFRTPVLHSMDPETPCAVSDLIIDHLMALGGPGSWPAGNQLRAARVLISDCQSVPANGVANDGIRSFALWGDPGSSDWVIQDCDFWTRGIEACVRLMATKRTVTHHCSLGVQGEKHCYRVHGTSSSSLAFPDLEPSQDNWISDCVLRRRGMMVASEPDGTERHPDVVRRFTMKRMVIDMLRDQQPGQDASMMFLPSSMQPRTRDGRLRLDGLTVEDVRYHATWDPLPTYMQQALGAPGMHWSFARNNYRHI